VRVCVTGGFGFIGARLCAALLQNGDEVVVVDNRARRAPLVPHVRQVIADVRDTSALDDAFRAADAVVHLAAVSSVLVAERDPAAAMSVNVQGTRAVVRAARRAGVGHLVLASSAAVYGRTDAPIGEEALVAPISVYGRSKALAERAMPAGDDPSGPVSTTLRLFNVYGPGQPDAAPAPVVAAALRSARTGEPFELRGDGEQNRDFVHVDDVVGAILASTSSRVSSTLNVGTGEGVTVSALLRAVESSTGVTIPVVVARRSDAEIVSSVAIVDAIRRAHPALVFRTLDEGLAAMLDASPDAVVAG
jgi:UDP-glucose 4-epimerase